MAWDEFVRFDYGWRQGGALLARQPEGTAQAVTCLRYGRAAGVQTLKRIAPLVPPSHCLVITAKALVPKMASLMPELEPRQMIGEPLGRNTAPCIAVGAAWMAHYFGRDTVMLVLSADHHIRKIKAFLEVLRTGVKAAGQGYLVTLGIPATRAETGYGYLELGKSLKGTIREVTRFLEKPDSKSAQSYYESGQYLWNSGMFIWSCSRILEELDKSLPELRTPLETYRKALGTEEEDAVLDRVYPEFPNISIDFGVMEKTNKVVTVPADIGWDDLGNWNVLERLHGSDPQGNVKVGTTSSLESKNCILSCDSGLIATYGVENLVIVKDGDAVLVMAKEKAADLKDLIAQLKKERDGKAFL